jgi:hypothetical protein
MMTFAVDNNLKVEMTDSQLCCDYDDWWDKCLDTCCAESNIDHWISLINTTVSKKILKVVFNKSNIDIFSTSWYSISNKSLINKVSPPYFDREISNYSYSNLVKIIKSNT